MVCPEILQRGRKAGTNICKELERGLAASRWCYSWPPALFLACLGALSARQICLFCCCSWNLAGCRMSSAEPEEPSSQESSVSRDEAMEKNWGLWIPNAFPSMNEEQPWTEAFFWLGMPIWDCGGPPRTWDELWGCSGKDSGVGAAGC